jgi:hypothetical protein
MMLPLEQVVRNGWPKVILRHAMRGQLPDAVRWRAGKQHLGWSFTQAFLGASGACLRSVLEQSAAVLEPYVDINRLKGRNSCLDARAMASVYPVCHLGAWLLRHSERPRVEGGRPWLPTRENPTFQTA